jgi:putative ABC transport system permease protein
MLQDLRYGARVLARSPGFTGVAILALALGIGANTAIFSVVHAVLLKALPYQDPDGLVVVWERNIPRDRRTNVASPGNFIAWREQNRVFEDMSAVSLTARVNLTGAGEPEELQAQLVNASFFPILGVAAERGRTFTPEEDRPASRVAVISHRLWVRRFGSAEDIVGRTITLSARAYTVVGVMPAGFSFLDRTVEVWVPVGFSDEARVPSGRWLIPIARLKPGVTVAQAQAEMDTISARLTQQFPEFDTGWVTNVVPLRRQLSGEIRPALLILAGAVGFVLLIACANVANLLLARSTSRQRELALRAALGAGRARIARQLLVESLLLAGAGGAAGLLLATLGVRWLAVFAAEHVPIPRIDTIGVDATVLGFTVVLSLASGLLFGLAPALAASSIDLNEALKDGGRTGRGVREGRTRQAFVVVEIALALMLLVGAGLLIRSFARLLDADPGFDAEGVLTMQVTLPSAKYREQAQRGAFFHELFARIDRLPGVRAAGGITFLPMSGLGSATSFDIVGRPKPPLGHNLVCDVRVITHEYFRAMGVPLLRGRLFTERERSEKTNVLVINEAMARLHFPNQDPIGQRLVISWSDEDPDEIIGVVRDVKHNGLDDTPRPMIYWAFSRTDYGMQTLAVRTATDPVQIARAVVAEVRAIDPDLPVANIRTMDEVLSRSVAQRRLVMSLLGGFAGVALMLAAVGIYGVMAYMVSQRTREIGVRLALGARPAQVLRLVVGQALWLAVLGVAAGLFGAYFLTSLMQTLLYGVTPTDPATFAAVALTLGIIALAASAVPGVRATRVDPAIALRAE